MTTNSNGPWTDWAVLEPSTPQFDKHGQPIKYRVQRNAEGTWRCYCKSFIFSGRGGAIKTCKHIRHCQHLDNGNTPVTMTTATVKSVPVAPAKHPQWDSAFAICDAMLDQARLVANSKQRDQMVEVLAKKLATFTPAKALPVVTPQTMTAGVRYITFDD